MVELRSPFQATDSGSNQFIKSEKRTPFERLAPTQSKITQDLATFGKVSTPPNSHSPLGVKNVPYGHILGNLASGSRCLVVNSLCSAQTASATIDNTMHRLLNAIFINPLSGLSGSSQDYSSDLLKDS